MSKTTKVFVFLLLVILISTSTFCYAGSISGTITESGTSAPIDSTILELYNTDWFFIGVAITDLQGNYQFTDLSNGDYHLFATGVRVEALERPKAHIAKYYDNATSRAQANSISVSGTVANINLSLAVGNTISGTVLSARDGRPATNAKVVVKEADRTADYATFTDSNGHYHIGGMDPAKEYYVQATGEWLIPEHGDIVTAAYEARYYPDATTYAAAELLPTVNNVTDIDFSLNEKALIYGWITDKATGRGITPCPIRF